MILFQFFPTPSLDLALFRSSLHPQPLFLPIYFPGNHPTRISPLPPPPFPSRVAISLHPSSGRRLPPPPPPVFAALPLSQPCAASNLLPPFQLAAATPTPSRGSSRHQHIEAICPAIPSSYSSPRLAPLLPVITFLPNYIHLWSPKSPRFSPITFLHHPTVILVSYNTCSITSLPSKLKTSSWTYLYRAIYCLEIQFCTLDTSILIEVFGEQLQGSRGFNII